MRGVPLFHLGAGASTRHLGITMALLASLRNMKLNIPCSGAERAFSSAAIEAKLSGASSIRKTPSYWEHFYEKRGAPMDSASYELTKVIGDFLEMGHLENIVAMFKQDTSHYLLTGELLRDDRFMVRMGVAVLFEELVLLRPDEVRLALPSLIPLLADSTPWVRGEAVNVLGIIGGDEAQELIGSMCADPDPQVREIANDFFKADE